MLTSFQTLSLISAASATTITSIRGPTFLSPYNGQTLTNITGSVATKVWHLTHIQSLPKVIFSEGPTSFWLAGEKNYNQSISTGITIFSSSAPLKSAA